VTISAKIIADSICNNIRITTFELEYPRYIHCFDDKTEILSQILEETPEFRSFEAVRVLKAKVAQYDPASEGISFVHPIEDVKNTGTYKMVTFDSNKHSMAVTDKHRVFTLKRTTGNAFIPDTILAEDLTTPSWGTRRIPKAGYIKQSQFYSNDELALIAWFVADGHRESSEFSSFHFKKPRKVLRVKQLLTTLGIEYKESVYNNDVVIRFISPHWVNQCYTTNGEKCYPPKALEMTQEGYSHWKQALLESDGCEESNTYFTFSKILSEQIQVVALLHGDAINTRYYSGCYTQKFQKTNYVSFRHDKDVFKEDIFENITVYCVTVPSSYVVVRRKGFAYVSGNCQLLTHRLFSKNSSSSRAIKLDKMIELIETNPVVPHHFGQNQAGMQAKNEEVENKDDALRYWKNATRFAIRFAKGLGKLGVHKQIVNRILEPFTHIKVVLTATEFDNFFKQRLHHDAQPEIQRLAQCMAAVMQAVSPEELEYGEWHTPYVPHTRTEAGQLIYGDNLSEENAVKLSVSCCAQVSYRKLDDSFEKALDLYDRLVKSDPPHLSPTEHQATPMTFAKNVWSNKAQTHMDKDGYLWSGNLRGWNQYRHSLYA